MSAVLSVVPITLKASNAFVASFHRHHRPVVGHKFSVAISDGAKVVGVAICGRPVARMSDDGLTLEVSRVCVSFAANGCSMLYRACWRAANALGYKRLITYTLGTETGASLRGAGFVRVGNRGGGSWSREDRKREDKHPLESKILWEIKQP